MTMAEDMKKADALKWLKDSKIEDIAIRIDLEEWLWELYPELKAEVEEYKRISDIEKNAYSQMMSMRSKWQFKTRPWNR